MRRFGKLGITGLAAVAAWLVVATAGASQPEPDTSPPTVHAIGSLAITIDQVYGSGAQLDLDATARDDGVGMARLSLERDDGSVVAQSSSVCATQQSAHACPAYLSLRTDVEADSLPEGLTMLHLTATDAAGNTVETSPWFVYVDRTGPDAVSGWLLVEFDAANHEAIVTWDAGTDAPAPDGTAGAGVERYRYRTRVGAAPWSEWTVTEQPQTGSFSATALSELQVQVVAIDAAGNAGRLGEWRRQLPAESSIADGSEEITGDDTAGVPTEGPAEFPNPTSTPPVAVPAGAQPADHYDRVDFDPEDTETAVTLSVVVPANADTFALSGVVIDAKTSDPIAGATVTLGNGAAEAQTQTDENGGYAFAEMPLVSGYRLVVKAPGHVDASEPMIFRISDGYERTVSLEPGG